MKVKNIILGLSGGMDSATLLAVTKESIVNSYKGDQILVKNVVNSIKQYTVDDISIHCFNFYYGSKHNKYERVKARQLAEYYKVTKYIEIDMNNIFNQFNLQSSTLFANSNNDIPEAHYEAPEAKSTVIPGRNTIMTSIMMGYAESLEGNGLILFGAHLGDRVNYPDCRLEYVNSLSQTFELATEGKVKVIAPFISITKIEICSIGLELKVPYEITRTCYKNQEVACGKCPSCIERIESFAKNKKKDPIEYEIDIDWNKEFQKYE